MKMFLCFLMAAWTVYVGDAVASGAEAAEKLEQEDTQPPSENGKGKETAWMISQTDLAKVWEEVDSHIDPVKADRTLPYYSYHVIDERYYIVIAYVDKERKIQEQWMDVTVYCEAQIPKLQEVGIYVKKAHELLDGITTREAADAVVQELQELVVIIVERYDRSTMPLHMFPQLIEQHHANYHSLFERMADIIRAGSFGSEKLARCLRMFFA